MKWLIRIGFIVSLFPLMAVKCAVDEGPGCFQHLCFTNNTDREIIVVETMPLKGKYADEFLSIEEYRLIKNGWRYITAYYHIGQRWSSICMEALGSYDRC